jgi:hypothetical protein
MFAPYRFERSASTKDLCRFCLRAGVFLGHHSRGDWTDVRFRIPVCSTTRAKSAIVFSLMIDGLGLSRLPDFRQIAAGQDCRERNVMAD